MVNTGVHGGVIQSIEEKLNTLLQWLICLRHIHELPLILIKKDGVTNGPKHKFFIVAGTCLLGFYILTFILIRWFGWCNGSSSFVTTARTTVRSLKCD
jgi:hypothetical protein